MVSRRAAEHAHAADRFAREIVGILTVAAVRSQRLMGRPLGRFPQHPPHLSDVYYPLDIRS